MNEIFVLHGAPFTWEGSMMVTGELALSNSRDILGAIAVGRGPRSFIIALGCAGWGPGSWRVKFAGNAWINGPFSETIAFHMEVERRWEAALRSIGHRPGTPVRYGRPCVTTVQMRIRKADGVLIVKNEVCISIECIVAGGEGVLIRTPSIRCHPSWAFALVFSFSGNPCPF